MTTYRIAEAADLLGVSGDTVRRWIDQGRLTSEPGSGPTQIAGTDLARFAENLALDQADDAHRVASRATSVSARNRLTGLVVRVKKDSVMAQVELICGQYRVVSLMSTEAAEELGLAPGERAIASVKSTNVVIERP